MRHPFSPLFLALTATLLLAVTGCGKKADEQGAGAEPQGTPVTVTTVSTADALVTERVLGRVESGTSPQVFPEVPGKVSRVLVDVGQRVKAGQTLAQLDTTDLALNAETARADVARIEALLAAQQRSAERIKAMWDRKLVSQGMYDDSQAQLKSLIEQLAGARARLASAQRALDKARITAPVDGVIQYRRIAPGDFVDGKMPAFLVTSDSKLRIHLPFPEEVAWRLRPGLVVRLTSPIAPEQKPIVARIDSVSPAVGGTSHAVEAIVHVANPGTWSEGATVNGEVVLAEHARALMVPEVSVVRRPAGEVVYVLKGNLAEQRIVTTGTHQDGLVEILSGLQNGDTVVVDGAGFLTDKAAVVIRK